MEINEFLKPAGRPLASVWLAESGNKRLAGTTSGPLHSTTNEEPSRPSQAARFDLEAKQPFASGHQPRSEERDCPSERKARKGRFFETEGVRAHNPQISVLHSEGIPQPPQVALCDPALQNAKPNRSKHPVDGTLTRDPV